MRSFKTHSFIQVQRDLFSYHSPSRDDQFVDFRISESPWPELRFSVCQGDSEILKSTNWSSREGEWYGEIPGYPEARGRHPSILGSSDQPLLQAQ